MKTTSKIIGPQNYRKYKRRLCIYWRELQKFYLYALPEWMGWISLQGLSVFSTCLICGGVIFVTWYSKNKKIRNRKGVKNTSSRFYEMTQDSDAPFLHCQPNSSRKNLLTKVRYKKPILIISMAPNHTFNTLEIYHLQDLTGNSHFIL